MPWIKGLDLQIVLKLFFCCYSTICGISNYVVGFYLVPIIRFQVIPVYKSYKNRGLFLSYQLGVGANPQCVSVVEFHDRALGIGKVFGQESTVVK